MKRIAGILVALVVGLVPSAASAEDKPVRVAALLIGDAHDEHIGAGVAANLAVMGRYVRGLPGFDAKRDLIILKEPQELSEKNILARIDDLGIGSGDIFFCYVACHGAHDPNYYKIHDDDSNNHFFQFPGGRVLHRLTLFRKAHVLITDTCNAPASIRPRGEFLGNPAAAGEPIESPVFAYLLRESAGHINISGSTQGQYGWYTPTGGLFTQSFVRTLQDLDAEAVALQKKYGSWDGTPEIEVPGIDRSNPLAHLVQPEQPAPTVAVNPFSRVGWSTFVRRLSDNTSDVYKACRELWLLGDEPADEKQRENRKLLRAQGDQRPQAFTLRAHEGYPTDLVGYKFKTEKGETIHLFARENFLLDDGKGNEQAANRMKGPCGWRWFGDRVLIELPEGRWYQLVLVASDKEYFLTGLSNEKPALEAAPLGIDDLLNDLRGEGKFPPPEKRVAPIKWAPAP